MTGHRITGTGISGMRLGGLGQKQVRHVQLNAVNDICMCEH